MYQSRHIRQYLIESLAYPRWMAVAKIYPKSCPHGGYFDASDHACWQCAKGTECQWLKLLDRSADASNMSAGELIQALDIAIGFLADYKSHHDRQVCDCRTCCWLRDTRHLVKRYRQRSALMPVDFGADGP